MTASRRNAMHVVVVIFVIYVSEFAGINGQRINKYLNVETVSTTTKL